MWKQEMQHFEAVRTNTKWQEVFWLGDFAFCVEKSRWLEFLWFVPQLWIHVDSVKQRHNLCMLRDLKAVQVHISATTLKD
jgi:hypothetical protein